MEFKPDVPENNQELINKLKLVKPVTVTFPKSLIGKHPCSTAESPDISKYIEDTYGEVFSLPQMKAKEYVDILNENINFVPDTLKGGDYIWFLSSEGNANFALFKYDASKGFVIDALSDFPIDQKDTFILIAK